MSQQNESTWWQGYGDRNPDNSWEFSQESMEALLAEAQRLEREKWIKDSYEASSEQARLHVQEGQDAYDNGLADGKKAMKEEVVGMLEGMKAQCAHIHTRISDFKKEAIQDAIEAIKKL